MLNYDVMVALPREQDLARMKDILAAEGCGGYVIVENNLELILRCEKNPPDILIIDMSLPFMDSIGTIKYLVENNLVKVIVAVDDDWEKSWMTSNLDWIDIFVTKPIEARKIIPSLLVHLSRKEKLQQLERDYRLAEEELRDQKITSYALQLVMDKLNLSEQEAEEYLTQLADQNGNTMKEIFQIIYSVLCNKNSTVK